MDEDNNKVTKTPGWIVAIVFAILWFIICIVPFFFMVMTGFKQKLETIMYGAFHLPEKLFVKNYIDVITDINFWVYFRNSVIVLVISLTLLLFVSACAAYALSRLHFKLRNTIYLLIVAAMSVPIHVTMIPIFQMTIGMGLYDSIWALVPTAVAFASPISVFILTGFMAGIPMELEEAADMDGCGRYKRFFQIILPLSTPGLSTLAIYNGVNIWNEFIFAFTLTQSNENRTLPLALWNYQGQYASNTAMIMACLTLSVMPMIVLFIIMQDKLVKGMMAGAVKG
ncbi:MAG: carbohydrate ABC transporter permease [Lachnospiraceae bacterium]|jgi:raffinose/stachyose/melibiose transport system permease protein|nr:carbohydrate ABC transporter permease [Lachnospiraceae bacterium]